MVCVDSAGQGCAERCGSGERWRARAQQDVVESAVTAVALNFLGSLGFFFFGLIQDQIVAFHTYT